MQGGREARKAFCYCSQEWLRHRAAIDSEKGGATPALPRCRAQEKVKGLSHQARVTTASAGKRGVRRGRIGGEEVVGLGGEERQAVVVSFLLERRQLRAA